jgi:hypothetical protein
MNWDAVGAIGENVGAIGVIVSVMYLALQVRKQTDESRLAASRELAEMFGNAMDRITDNLEFTSIYLKACQNYNELPNTERLWASFVFQRFCRIMEQQRLHLINGNVDPVYFESLHSAWLEWLTFPGAQQWWAVCKNMFGEEFKKYTDELIAEAKSKGYQSTFKAENTDPTVPFDS